MKKVIPVIVWVLTILLFMGVMTSCASDTKQQPTDNGSEISEGAQAASAGARSETDPVQAETPDPELLTKAGPLPEDAHNGYSPLKEEITLTIGRAEDERSVYKNGETSSDNYVIQFFSKTLNTKFDIAWGVTGTDAYKQKVSLQIATGDIPDLMVVDEPQLRQLVKAGMVADLTDAYAQYASELLRDSYATTNGIALESATFDGKLRAIPNINPGADGINLLYVRADWMEELGLSEPKSMDDVTNIVKTFKEKKNSTGLVCSKEIVKLENNPYGMDSLFALYGSYPEMWIEDGSGKIMYGSIAPETKTALEEIAKLVENGVIDRDFVVRDTTQCEELVTSSQGGIFFGPWWTLQWPLVNMNKTDPEPRWNLYAIPLDDSEKFNTHMINPTKQYLVLRKDHENPEAAAEAVIKYTNLGRYLDWANGLPVPEGYDPSDASPGWPIGILLTTYDDKEQFAINVQAVIDGEKDYEELSPFHKVLYDNYLEVEEKGVYEVYQEKSVNEWAWVVATKVIVENEENLNRVFASTYSKSPTMDKKWATLEKLEDEIFLQIILGEKDISAFDDFVSQWKQLGGDEITQELIDMKN